MDMVKIGKFLAQLRREKELTQEQLGEQLGVTNKTISRWENGNYLPPVEMLQLMSGIYDVSINEILSGERLTPDNYREKAEENIAAAISESSFPVKERVEYYRKKWTSDHLAGTVTGYVLFAAALAAGVIFRNTWLMATGAAGLFGWHILRYNQMMAYIERNAYDGRGQKPTAAVEVRIKKSAAVRTLCTALWYAICAAAGGYIIFNEYAWIIHPRSVFDVLCPAVLTFALYWLLSVRTELSVKQKIMICASADLLIAGKYAVDYLYCMSSEPMLGISSVQGIIAAAVGIHLAYGAVVPAVSVSAARLFLRISDRNQSEE